MHITGSSTQPYVSPHKTSLHGAEPAKSGIGKNPVENTDLSAIFSTRSATIAAPLVSSSVQSTLLRLQETGSVFDTEDTNLMHVRGISDQDRQRFSEIIVDAAQTGGYNNPVEYIHSLSKEDIEVLRRVHSLAETSGVTNTDTEGAINLLLPRNEHVDINNDGLVKNGAATGFYFPPPNSPQSVKDAWAETVKDMTFAEKMMAEAQFMTASIGANIKFDSDGNAVGLYEHTDPEYTNIFPTSEDGWEGLLDKLVADYEKALSRSPELAKHLEMLNEFAENISSEDEDSV